MSFFEELISQFENQTDNFVFDATNIDGIYKYLKTVRINFIFKYFTVKAFTVTHFTVTVKS